MRQSGSPADRVHEADRGAATPCEEERRFMIDPPPAAEQGTEIGIQRIMGKIPHRHPVLMIDKGVDVVANQRGTGVKNPSKSEEYFSGHFPAPPAMPDA